MTRPANEITGYIEPRGQLASGCGCGFEPSVKRVRRNGVGSTQGRIARDHVGDELSRARADAKTVTRKAGRDKKSRHAVDRRDHRDRIGHHVDHPAPALGDGHIAEQRKGLGDCGLGAVEDIGVGLGIEHAHRFERRSFVQTPAPRHSPFLGPAAADPKAQLFPMQPRRRQIREEQPEIVGDKVDRTHPQCRHGVAAVHPLADAEQPARRRDFRPARQRLGAHDRGQHFELRQFDAEIAAEQARPRATREHDTGAADPPLFGDDTGDAAARGFDAPHRALGHDRRAFPPRRLGDRRRRPLRLGLAVARREQASNPVAGQPRHQLGCLGAGQEPRVELILARVIEPGFELAQFGGSLRQVHDAGLAKPGFRLDLLVNALPQP